MSRLEVIYRLGLAHPFLVMDSLNSRASVHFPDTGNTVWVEMHLVRPEPTNTIDRGVFDLLSLHVERECDPADRDVAYTYETLQQWGIVSDAATTLSRFLEYVRDEDFVRNGTVAGYPAVPSDRPQDNPAVQTAKAEIIFDGEQLTTMPFGGIPSIQITPGVWDHICERLRQADEVPAYRSFLLDAFYFATSGDPVRAVIMGCAAWETALRIFLSSVEKTVSAYANIPRLTRLTEQIKGGPIFDWTDNPVAKLVTLRNDLLHQGKKDLMKEDIVGMVLAVDAAITWIFDPKTTVQKTPP
jgi:hypothetical protein